ncbi:MAG: hypothetical protein ABLQ96_12755 [Candidatus Acidiferrum sp.]
MNLHIPLAVLLLAAVGAPADTVTISHRHSVSISGDEDGPVPDCDGLHIRFGDHAATMRTEERAIPRPAGTLRIESEVNGGLQVRGWDKEDYSVTVCKAVEASRSNAEQIFSQIKLSVEGGKVSVSGPSDRDRWTVFLLVRAPRSADLELHANNGPLSIYDLDAKLTARAVNGPISLTGFSGEGDISAQNGPVDLNGNSGKLRLHTQNGPISVDLKGDSWKGSGLVADAQNGPLNLRLPKNYRSSVLLESNGNSPMSCHASVCDDARKTWDEDHRRIEFGNAPAAIHLSTVNGPISVD